MRRQPSQLQIKGRTVCRYAMQNLPDFLFLSLSLVHFTIPTPHNPSFKQTQARSRTTSNTGGYGQQLLSESSLPDIGSSARPPRAASAMGGYTTPGTLKAESSRQTVGSRTRSASTLSKKSPITLTHAYGIPLKESSMMRLSAEQSASKVRKLPLPNPKANALTSRQLEVEIDSMKVVLNLLMKENLEKQHVLKLKEMEAWRNKNLRYRLTDRSHEVEEHESKLDEINDGYDVARLKQGTYKQMINRITESNAKVHSEIRDLRDEVNRADKAITSLRNNQREVHNSEIVAKEEKNFVASKRRGEIAEWMGVVNNLKDQLESEDSIYDAFETSADSREAIRLKVKEMYYMKARKEADKQKKRVESAVVDSIKLEKEAKHLARSFEVLMNLTNSNDLDSLVSFFVNKDSTKAKLEEQMSVASTRREDLLKEEKELDSQLMKWRFGEGPDVGGGEMKMPYDDVMIEVSKKQRDVEKLSMRSTALMSMIKNLDECIGHMREVEDSATGSLKRATTSIPEGVPPLNIAGSAADKEPTAANGGTADGGDEAQAGAPAEDGEGGHALAAVDETSQHAAAGMQKRASSPSMSQPATKPSGYDIPAYEKNSLFNLGKLSENLEKKLAMIEEAGIDPSARFEPEKVGIKMEETTLGDNNRRVMTAAHAREVRDAQIREWMTDHRHLIPRAVQAADDDGSGEVDPRELSQAVSKLGFPVTVHEMLRFSKRLDQDKSGYLELREIIEMDELEPTEGDDGEVLDRAVVKLKAERMSRGR